MNLTFFADEVTEITCKYVLIVNLQQFFPCYFTRSCYFKPLLLHYVFVLFQSTFLIYFALPFYPIIPNRNLFQSFIAILLKQLTKLLLKLVKYCHVNTLICKSLDE